MNLPYRNKRYASLEKPFSLIMENQSKSNPSGAAGSRSTRGRQNPASVPRETNQRRFVLPTHRACIFCKDKNKVIDYKNGEALRRYLTDLGKIRPRRKIGTCARHQRQLALAIKRARHLALLPFAPAHVRGEF